jgi:hypothetical protein
MKRRIGADLGDRDLLDDGVVGECSAAEKLRYRLPPPGKRTVGSKELQELQTEIGPAGGAILALPAFRHGNGQDVIAGGDARHAWPDFHDDTGSLVPQYDRVGIHGHRSVDQMVVRVTKAARLDLDQHFALARPGDLDFIDLEGAVLPHTDCGP